MENTAQDNQAKVHNVRLTEQQTKEFQEAFSLFDRKGTNCVELGDVGPLIRSVGLSPSESDVKGMQHDIERSGKRALEYQDFLDLVMRNQNLKETSENIREAFRTFDKDGNGFVSAAELRHVLTSLGERLSDEEVDELIREADITGDGQVNYDEDVTRSFLDGQFAVRSGFNGKWSDMATESTVIRESKSDGGVVGLARKDSASYKEGNGWQRDGDDLKLKLFGGPSASEMLDELLCACRGRHSCNTSCSCSKNGMACTEHCLCNAEENCMNEHNVHQSNCDLDESE